MDGKFKYVYLSLPFNSCRFLFVCFRCFSISHLFLTDLITWIKRDLNRYEVYCTWSMALLGFMLSQVAKLFYDTSETEKPVLITSLVCLV